MKFKWTVITQCLFDGGVKVRIFDTKKQAEAYHLVQEDNTRQWIKKGKYEEEMECF